MANHVDQQRQERSYTIVHSAKTSISKFSRRVKIVGGFFKFGVAEDLNPKVGTRLCKVGL